jgi:micrococcal nuclease
MRIKLKTRPNLLNISLFLLTLIFFVQISQGQKTKVVRIIDGDTFEIEKGEKVRMVGINAPEISDFFGIEAKNFLSDLIKNRYVDLRPDGFSNDRDRFQRLIRYVYLDNEDINKKMISSGFAFAYLKYNFEKATEYEQIQIESREKNIGIWGNDMENDSTLSHNPKSKESTSIKSYLIGCLLIILIAILLYTLLQK